MSSLLDITVVNRPEHAVEYLAILLQESALPLEYVAKYDEPLLPQYPAAVVRSGQYTKEVHGTQTWLLTLRCEIYVMHARMTTDRATRNREDLELATKVVSLLERDKKLGGRVVFSHVENEVPGAMPPRSEKAAAVVSTRLAWQAITEARF